MYEIIVVGGGHAGCEASLACARKGHKTLLITGNINNIADMPCNPSIGGSAKGIVVREIDALGGEMGRNADKSLLQIKMLNSAKGPAVRALRAQADKKIYPKKMLEYLENNNYDSVHLHVYNAVGNIYGKIAFKYSNNVIIHAHCNDLAIDFLNIKHMINAGLRKVYNSNIKSFATQVHRIQTICIRTLKFFKLF